MDGIECVQMSLDIEDTPPKPKSRARRMTRQQYDVVMRALKKGMPMREIADHAHMSAWTLRQLITRYHIEN